MEPILVPAWPAALRVGLPVVALVGARELKIRCGVVVAFGRVVRGDSPVMVAHIYDADQGKHTCLLGEIRLDLRDPAVRDAVVRAMWRKLRPEEPEPLTAPRFANECRDGVREFVLEVNDEIIFALDNNPPYDVKVPALASVPLDSPDCDLLALAACAAQVLS